MGPIRLRLATEEHAKRNRSQKFEAQGLMIPEMPPQRSAKPGFAPSSIIERAAQHLDWTIAFGMRHNSLRGLEETTNQQMRPDPPGITVARLRCGPAGKRRLLFTSSLCLVSIAIAAAASQPRLARPEATRIRVARSSAV